MNTVPTPALRYYGSKWRLADWIIDQFPPSCCWWMNWRISSPRAGAGRVKTEAQLLSGRGDFLAVGKNTLPIRFQAAFIKEQDARQRIREA